MPTLSDLDAAMLRPTRAVPAIGRLGGGTVLLAGADQPWRVVGRSAAVYQLRQPGGRELALRCPLAEASELDPGLEGRYRALANAPALAALRAMGGPLVDHVAYFPEGLTLPAGEYRSASHPVVAMGWATGATLLAAADRAARGGDRAVLEGLADGWAAAVGALAGAGFVHGDLAADNALVRPGGGIALVDYDASSWPGSPDPPRPGAAGTAVGPAAGYGHPSPEAPPADRRDRFPALVVYASLRFLAARPELRERFGDPAGWAGGTLLFGADDLARPDGSLLFEEVRGLPDDPERELAEMLREACVGRAAATPDLADVVADLRRATRRAGPRATSPVEAGWPEAVRPAMSSWPVRPARAATPEAPPRPPPRDRHGGSGSEAITPSERQRRLTRLNSLLLAGDEEGARRYWRESGLDRDPEAIRDLGPRLAAIERGEHRGGAGKSSTALDSDVLRRRWHEVGLDEQRHRPIPPLPPVSDPAGERRAMVDRLGDALERGDERAVLRLWPQLRGDPIVSALAIRAQAVLAGAAEAAMAAAIADGDDEDIVASVGEAEENGVAVGANGRRAARAAADRLATRQALRAAIADDDRPELAALALSGRLGEVGRLEPKERRAALRALAWPHLERALAAEDDAAILAASDDELFADGDALSAAQRSRIELARGRTAWLEATRAALRRRDVAALRAALVKPPPGAEARLSRVERGRIERLTMRDEAAAQLARALREGPDTAVLAALERVEAAGAALPEALDWAAVRGVVDRVTLAEAIREAAANDPPDYGRLARLLPAARAAMVASGAGIGPDIDFARLESDVLRAAHLGRLREALATEDDAEIAAAADPDPFEALARLPAAERDRVERALRAARPSRSGRA